MSSLSTGLLGFAQGALGTISNEYENINKEKRDIRDEERAQLRQLEQEQRAEARLLEKEERDEAYKLAAEGREEERAKRARALAEQYEIRGEKRRQMISQQNYQFQTDVAFGQRLLDDNVAREQIESGTYVPILSAEAQRKALGEVDIELDQQRLEQGLPISNASSPRSALSEKAAMESILSRIHPSIVSNPDIDTDYVKLAIANKEDPKYRIQSATKSKDIKRVFKDADSVDLLKVQVMQSLAPTIRGNVSALVRKGNVQSLEDLQTIVDSTTQQVQDVVSMWADTANMLSNNGSLTSEGFQQIDRAVSAEMKASNTDARTAVENLQKKQGQILRSLLGENEYAYPALNNLQRPILKSVYDQYLARNVATSSRVPTTSTPR